MRNDVTFILFQSMVATLRGGSSPSAVRLVAWEGSAVSAHAQIHRHLEVERNAKGKTDKTKSVKFNHAKV